MVEFHWGGGGKAPPPKPPVSTPVHIGLLWRIKKFKLPTCDLQQELNSRGCAGLTSFYLRCAVLMISSVVYTVTLSEGWSMLAPFHKEK